jgi:hypothetical protein
MALRTLKRKVIIREYDFHKVKADVVSTGFTTQVVLYDRVEFKPIKRDDLEKENLLRVLKQPEKSNPFKPTEIPALFLFNVKDYLYNEKYIEWNAEYDEDGYIWVQARKNTPRSKLGWGVFEKDFHSRL